MGFIYSYLASDPLQMSLLVFKTFPIEFALGADHFNLDRVREDGLLRVTIYIDRPKSIHSRCGKCAKCQIFGTFTTPNTKMMFYEMCQISKIIQHGYNTVANLQRYGQML